MSATLWAGAWSKLKRKGIDWLIEAIQASPDYPAAIYSSFANSTVLKKHDAAVKNIVS